ESRGHRNQRSLLALCRSGLDVCFPAHLHPVGRCWWSFGKVVACSRLEAEESRMSEHVEEHFAGSNKLFTSIWFWLVLLTLVEIGLAYKPMPIHFMLTILLGLSIIKAALIVAYFMHLKFERLSLILTIVPMLVICICLLLIFFPDSFRLHKMRTYNNQPATTATQE